VCVIFGPFCGPEKPFTTIIFDKSWRRFGRLININEVFDEQIETFLYLKLLEREPVHKTGKYNI
jgi:hypothetical protein